MSCQRPLPEIETDALRAPLSARVNSDTILLVEDDPDIRTVLVECLEGNGFNVVDAETAEAAAEILKQGCNPALVLTDINLGPGENGMVFADRVHRATPQTPVVFMTGRLDMLSTRANRPDEFVLPKPFSLTALIGIVRRFASGQAPPFRR